MGLLRDDSIGTSGFSIQDTPPTFGQSFGATVDETIAGNPTSVLLNLAEMHRANDNGQAKLGIDEAQNLVKESGVSGITVKDGEYTQEALSMIIERQRKAAVRNDVMRRTEFSAIGTPARGLAMLGASILDPLNVASAFIPAVGEARIASILGKTAAGSLARAGARAGIGVVEGVAGAALMEPAMLYGRAQLQDDYHMSDSLLNVAFGGALGGGLHVVGGHIADAFNSSDPYTRFSGLDPAQVRAVLDYESSLKSGASAADKSSQTDGWTPQMRSAAGIVERQDSPTLAPEQIFAQAQDIPSGISREDFQALYESYPKEVVEAIAKRVALRNAPDIPFAKLVDTTPDGAIRIAAGEMAQDLRAELLPQAGNRSAAGDIARLRGEMMDLDQNIRANDSRFPELAKQWQEQGLSRKQAEAKARKEIEQSRIELDAKKLAIKNQIDTNASASQAEQDIAALDRGDIPDRFREKVQSRANQIMAAADTARTTRPSARSIVAAASSSAREAAFRSAVAQAVNGRAPEVELLVRPDPPSMRQVKMIADRQADADSLAIGDPSASSSASQRLKQAPHDAGLVAAESELAKASDRLNNLRENLEQGGMSKERTNAIFSELAPFDAGLADADAYGLAARAAAICGMRS